MGLVDVLYSIYTIYIMSNDGVSQCLLSHTSVDITHEIRPLNICSHIQQLLNIYFGRITLLRENNCSKIISFQCFSPFISSGMVGCRWRPLLTVHHCSAHQHRIFAPNLYVVRFPISSQSSTLIKLMVPSESHLTMSYFGSI